MTEVQSPPIHIKPTSQLIVADASSLPLTIDSKNQITTSTKSLNVKIKRSNSSFTLNRLSLLSLDSTTNSNSPFSIFQRRVFSNPTEYSSPSRPSSSHSPSPSLSSSSSSPPSPSSSLATSPNATTISSHDGSSLISRSLNLASPENTSLLNHRSNDSSGFTTPRRSSRYSTRRKSVDSPTNPIKDEFSRDFKLLDSELPKFQSKSGVHRSNILRLALLPFLRQHRGEDYYMTASNSKEINYYRIKILQKWWNAILNAFKDRSISGSDRSLYLEGLSGLMSRMEWRLNPIIYQQLLYETLQLVISKLSLKTVPLSVAAFSGKALAYAFFFAPDIAPVLLHLLAVPQNDIDRVINCSFPSSHSPSKSQYLHHQQFASCSTLADASLILTSNTNLPKHLEPLVGYCDGRKSPAMIPSRSSALYNASHFYRSVPAPPPPAAIPNIYGPWSRRWASSNSDVFIAFIKHYYSIMSILIPQDLPWNAHLASPGLIILQSFLLGSLDFAVHPHEHSHSNSPFPSSDVDDLNTVAVSPVPAIRTRRRVDQLKVLAVIREILHNDDACIKFYEPYCRQFERLLHAVALKTSVYDVESCIILADLVEEYLSSLILSHSLTKQTVEIQKDKIIDWQFWIHVIQRMMSSDNSHTELRALAFLFNIWDNIPIGCNPGFSISDPLGSSRLNNGLEFTADENEGLRWNVIVWLLSPSMWKRYFCHWQPLVRAYYHRLLCWRVASVGPESDLLSSVLYSNCNADARILLSQRLETSYEKVLDAIEYSKQSPAMLPSLEPAPPVVNRQLSIFLNPAVRNGNLEPGTPMRIPSESSISNITSNKSINLLIPRAASESSLSSQHLHRVNPFDVFDDVAYSYPPMASPKDNLFLLGHGLNQPSNINNDHLNDHEQTEETATNNSSKKRWSLLRPNGLRKYFSSGNVRVSSAPTIISSSDPEKGFTSSVPSSTDLRPVKSRTPSIKASPGTFSSKPNSPTSSLTMSLIPPPPQLLRERPEINRPPYKFCLEFCEKIARKQLDLIIKKNRGVSIEDSELKSPVKPRLPFDYDDRVETLFGYGEGASGEADDDDDVYKTCVSEAEAEFESEFEFSTPLISIEDEAEFTVDDIADAYGSSSDEITGAEIVDSFLAEKRERIPVTNKLDTTLTAKLMQANSEDSKYWSYAGRSLSEWSETVHQFEEFVRSRRMMGGVTRLEDIGVPFFVAEIPAKVLAG